MKFDKEKSLAISCMRVIGMLYVALIQHILPIYIEIEIAGISVFHVCMELFSFLGVSTFFAISGYLFGWQHRSNEERSVSDAGWLKKRATRILLPYEFVLMCVVVTCFFIEKIVKILPLGVSFLNLQGIFQLKYSFDELGHTWFLSILMVCYVLTLVLKRISGKIKAVYCGAFVIVILMFSYRIDITSTLYTGYIFLYSIMFFWGKAGNCNLERQIKKVPIYVWGCVIVLMMGLRIVLSFTGDSLFYVFVVCVTGIVNTLCWFICGFYKLSPLLKKVNRKIESGVKYLDSISYEFYLVHGVLVTGCTSIVGLLYKSKWEIVVILVISVLFSQMLHTIIGVIIKKGTLK